MSLAMFKNSCQGKAKDGCFFLEISEVEIMVMLLTANMSSFHVFYIIR